MERDSALYFLGQVITAGVIGVLYMAATDSLTKREREAFEHRLQGHSHKHTAAAMNITEGTLEQYLNRAYKKVCHRLEQNGHSQSQLASTSPAQK